MGYNLNECNFTEVTEREDNYNTSDEFVCGVSTDINLKTKKNYLKDLINDSHLYIRENKHEFIMELYRKHKELGLFYCFIREEFLKKMWIWTNINIIWNTKNSIDKVSFKAFLGLELGTSICENE